MKILLSFIHPHVPNLYDFLLQQEHKRMIKMYLSIDKNKKNIETPLTFIVCMNKKTQPNKNVKTFFFLGHTGLEHFFVNYPCNLYHQWHVNWKHVNNILQP